MSDRTKELLAETLEDGAELVTHLVGLLRLHVPSASALHARSIEDAAVWNTHAKRTASRLLDEAAIEDHGGAP